MTRARSLAIVAAALLAPAALLVTPAAQADGPGPRVVNGREPVPGEVRSLVQVRAGGSLCSGTLVDTLHVITAAHCAYGRGIASFDVGWTPTNILPVTTRTPVTAVDVHPDYDNRTYVNDIAVLTLASPFPGAVPMPLASATASRGALGAGDSVRAAGFGYTAARGPLSDRARVGDLVVVPNRVCGAEDVSYDIGGVTFIGLGIDTSTAVCAIGVEPSTAAIIDTCQGDSGGPLYADVGPGERLLGLVSVGVGCAGFDDGGNELEDKTPGVYTRIAPYLDWLVEVGVEKTPAPPAITATSTGVDGISVAFAPGAQGVALSYQAVAIFGDSSTDCSASATTPTCTITGLEPGTTYTVVGYALGARGRSDASSPTTAIAGTPTAAPPKPRIDSTKVTPGRRIAFAVSRLDTADWTTSFIVCTAGDSTVRKDVVDGRAVLSLRRGETYRCYAKSTNEVGAQRSKPVKVQV